jgi:hypothetical protein
MITWLSITTINVGQFKSKPSYLVGMAKRRRLSAQSRASWLWLSPVISKVLEYLTVFSQSFCAWLSIPWFLRFPVRLHYINLLFLNETIIIRLNLMSCSLIVWPLSRCAILIVSGHQQIPNFHSSYFTKATVQQTVSALWHSLKFHNIRILTSFVQMLKP